MIKRGRSFAIATLPTRQSRPHAITASASPAYSTRFREQFPDFFFIGHFDKMTMNCGEEAMRAESERLVPIMKSGGFIPSVDHQTPPGVSLEQYRCYLRLLDEYTGKAGGPV